VIGHLYAWFLVTFAADAVWQLTDRAGVWAARRTVHRIYRLKPGHIWPDQML
jgi:hypothetical protein